MRFNYLLSVSILLPVAFSLPTQNAGVLSKRVPQSTTPLPGTTIVTWVTNMMNDAINHLTGSQGVTPGTGSGTTGPKPGTVAIPASQGAPSGQQPANSGVFLAPPGQVTGSQGTPVTTSGQVPGSPGSPISGSAAQAPGSQPGSGAKAGGRRV